VSSGEEEGRLSTTNKLRVGEKRTVRGRGKRGVSKTIFTSILSWARKKEIRSKSVKTWEGKRGELNHLSLQKDEFTQRGSSETSHSCSIKDTEKKLKNLCTGGS